MSLRASLVWKGEYGDIELASTIDPEILYAIKEAALRMSQHKIAANTGDEVREVKFNADHKALEELLDYALPRRLKK